MIAEMLEFQLAGDTIHAAAYNVQCLQTLLQVALDGGDWTVAVHLLPIQNPLERAEFGGDEDELQCVHSYQKALKELRSKMHLAQHHAEEGTTPSTGSGYNGEAADRPTWKAKAKAKAAAKAAVAAAAKNE